jgi:CheY-like chemotaxis protein
MPVPPAHPPSFSVVRSATDAAPIPIKHTDKSEPATAPVKTTPKSPEPIRPPNGIKMPDKQNIHNPHGNRELILLVDDEAQVAELAAQMLSDEGYKVIVAHDGFEALKIYQQMGRQIGLVILDFFLPVMDGDAVFDELRTLNPDIDVVLSSGFAEQSKLGNMLARGLRGFIPKPYSREKLLEQVRSTLEAGRHALK